MSGLKNLVQEIFHRAGFELSRFPKKQAINKRDQHIIQLLKKYNIDLVLDVGAARGQYAEWLIRIGYSNIIASFEPLPDQYTILQENAKLHPKLKVMERCAIGDKEGHIDFNVSQNLDSSSVLNMLETHSNAAPHSIVVSTITVPIRRLDSFKDEFIKSYSSIFLKIDVQGFEKPVMEGASLLMPFIKGLQVELSLIPLYEGQVLYREMIDYIESIGFKLYSLRPGFADPGGRLLQFDGIFFKE